ncbi:MAG: hypothetical protein KatS3mg068_1467 [Candidatus Sericytochromatia bacterium]|nr:MAG: hypothetical protein KatS3mg068_1467 [Candidatus Sericytochromatia bacterium]
MVKFTKICYNCKSIIDSNYIFCPNCRSDVRTYRQRFISSMIFAFVVILISGTMLIFLIKNYLFYFFVILFFFILALGIGVSLKK